MKRFIYSSMLLMGICVLVACTGKSSSHPFGGTFFTEEGVRFELKADSTTLTLRATVFRRLPTPVLSWRTANR